MECYGYHEFGYFQWTFRLKRLLYPRAWLSNENPGLMFDFATELLLQNKLLLPEATTLVCFVTELRGIPEGQRISPLEQLKKGPVTVSGLAFTEALERYTRLRNLEFFPTELELKLPSSEI